MTGGGFNSNIINRNDLNRIWSITIINKIQSQFLGCILKKISQICRMINHCENFISKSIVHILRFLPRFHYHRNFCCLLWIMIIIWFFFSWYYHWIWIKIISIMNMISRALEVRRAAQKQMDFEFFFAIIIFLMWLTASFKLSGLRDGIKKASQD